MLHMIQTEPLVSGLPSNYSWAYVCSALSDERTRTDLLQMIQIEPLVSGTGLHSNSS